MAGPIQSSISQSISTAGQFIGLAKLKAGQDKQVKASNKATIKATESEKASRAMISYQQNEMVRYLDVKDKTELAKEKADAEARLDSEFGINSYTAAYGKSIGNPNMGKYITVGDVTRTYGEIAFARGNEYADKLMEEVENRNNIGKDEYTKLNRDINSSKDELAEQRKYWTEYYSTPEGRVELEKEIYNDNLPKVEVTKENSSEIARQEQIAKARALKALEEVCGPNEKDSPEIAKIKANFLEKGKQSLDAKKGKK